jgi:uncharacterized membrane protein
MPRGRFLKDTRGGVAIIVAFSGMAMLAMAALAVDLGAIYVQSRQLQGIADLAAMSGANDLARAQAAVSATTTLNGWRNGTVQAQAVVGTYTPLTNLDPEHRFVAGGLHPNAVRATLTAPAQLYFGGAILGRSQVTIRRSATAARPQLATFQIGSRLAALNGGVANAVLSGLTGSSVSLSVMDYNALATADVDLLHYMTAMQTHLHLQGASFDKVLAASINNQDALGVLADTLHASGSLTAETGLRKIAAAASKDPADLSSLIDLGPYGGQDRVVGPHGAGISVNALDLAQAMLALSQGGRQVKLALGATIPGLASADVWLAIGERPNKSPWVAIDDAGGTTIRTAQTRLYVETTVGASGLLATAGIAQVKLPILVELASAEAKLSSLDCAATPSDRSVTLAVRPSVGHAAIADIDTTKLNDFKHALVESPAPLVKTLLITATGQADVDLGGQQWQQVKFTQADIDKGNVKTVSTRDIVQASLASLLGDLDLQVNILGLGLGLGKTALTSALAATLATAAPSLDNLLNSVTDLLGLHLGQADVRVDGLRCKTAVLVS